jgi:predicted DNA-binding WGR domain protein
MILIDIKKLHCTTGTSDKLYVLQVYENTKTGEYELHSEYGRRGRAMTINPVIVFNRESQARNKFSKISMAKQKKGYQDITQPDDMESRFNDAYVKDLSSQAAILCAEGSLERPQYNSIKGMLASGDEPSQRLAEEMIKAKNQKLVA